MADKQITKISQMLDQHASEESVAAVNSPHRRFSAQVAWTLAARLLMTINSVGTGIIIARWLGAEGLGVYAVLNVAVVTAIQIGSAGLPAANTYFIAQDRRYLANVFANAVIFALLAGGALAFGLIVLAFVRAEVFGEIPLVMVAVAAVSIPFQIINLLGLNIFLAAGSVGRFNLLDAAGQSLILLNAVGALVVAGAGLLTLVSLNTLAAAAVSFVIMWMIYRDLQSMPGRSAVRPDAQLFRRMARYGLKFHVSTVAAMLIFRADLLIVQYFRGAAEAGVYAVASQAAMMLMLLPAVIGTLLFPRVASTQKEARDELTCVATRHTAFIMLIVCLMAAPASFLLPLFYGAPFADATVQLLLLLPGVYFVSIESVLVQYFTGTGLPAAIPWFWVATLLANVILNLALVPAFGARGAALASAVSYAMIFVLVGAYFCSQTGRGPASVLLLRVAELRAMLALVPLGMHARGSLRG